MPATTRMRKTAPGGLLATLMLLALPGCERVEFQSPPSEPLQACSEEWIGDWRLRPVRDQDEDGDPGFLRVGEDCRPFVLVSFGLGEDGAERFEVEELRAQAHIGFATTAAWQVFAWREKDKPEREETRQPAGYSLYAWQRRGAFIELREADPRKAAHLVIDDRHPGWIDKRDRRPDGSRGASTLFVFLFGSSAEIASLLDREELFGEVVMRLEPLGEADLETLEAALREAPVSTPGDADGPPPAPIDVD